MSNSVIGILIKSVLAVMGSIAIVEISGLNRIVRHVIQIRIQFLQLETILGVSLLLLLATYVLRIKNSAQLRFLPLIAAGFMFGLLSGLVATVSLSILNWNQRGIFNSNLSLHDVGLFIALSMLGTLGWLIGSLAGSLLYLSMRTKT